jgi:hypothetical protein
MKRIAFLLIAVGCTGTDVHSMPGDSPDGGASDAPAIDTQTLCGAALPTSAPPSIRVSGEVVAVPISPTPTMGMTIDLWKRGGTEPLAVKEHGFGDFEFTAYTQSLPLDAYIHAADTGHADLYYFFPIPLTRNYFLDKLPMFTESDLEAIGPHEEGTAAVVVAMHDDCDGTDKAVTGASVMVTPAIASTTTRYVSATSQTPTFQTAPDSTTAGAVILNVPPGNITITTSNASRPLRTAHVVAYANSLTMVDLYPQ